MATGPDGATWTKSAANPALTPPRDSPFDATYNSARSVLPDGEYDKFCYGARIDQFPKYYAIGLAEHPGPLVAR